MSNKVTTVLLCGVGGQGTILAADLLARAVLAAGLDVKVSEIHGMSQRGGSVTTVVRYGQDVQSMVADFGCADVIVSFETTEALRNLPYLKEGGSLVVNNASIESLPVLSGKARMPDKVEESLAAVNALVVPASKLARDAGNAKTGNVVLLGALSARLDIPMEIWEETVAGRVPPKTVEANLSALRLGRQFVTER